MSSWARGSASKDTLCVLFAPTRVVRGSLVARLAAAWLTVGFAWAGQAAPARTTLAGIVRGPDGVPVVGAVVVTSAGGRGVTDASGRYTLELELPAGSSEIRLTAVGGAGGTQVANARLLLGGSDPGVGVEPLVLARASTCPARWLPTFGGEPGADRDVLAFAVHDDGSGPALYVGGEFTSVGGVAAAGIARWDGVSWSEVAGGVSGALVAGQAVGVHALLVHDDGGGARLFALGHFAFAGGVTANHVARWDGSSWSALGGGLGGIGHALATHDDGSGSALYVGGSFLSAGSAVAFRVARWNGASWSAVGQPNTPNNTVRALAVYDDGGGTRLYAGGDFTTVGATPARRVARWDGANWTALGSGVSGMVNALVVHDDGSGSALFVGGAFTTAGGAPANRIARWNGAWSAVGSGTDATVLALGVHDEGSGPRLFAGGQFTQAGGVAAEGVACWDGAAWSALGPGVGPSVAPGLVRALTSFDGGAGPLLFVGGALRSAGPVAANRIATWDGAGWSALGSGPNDALHSLLVFDDGAGPALFAGGAFTDLAGVAASRVARWDGSAWTPLGSGMGTDGSIPRSEVRVSALAVHDDGGGPALYAGGAFKTAGGLPASRIARWDGVGWVPLGTGTNEAVEALASFDDGSGPALFAAGSFTTAGGVAVNGIARWNGAAWSALGAGTSGSAPLAVTCLAVHDDGGGPALFAAGHFERMDGLLVNHIARWDGAAWSALGVGLAGTTVPSAAALLSFEEGGGPSLVVAGQFLRAGGLVAVGVARWDGASWAPLGSFPFFGTALGVLDEGFGPTLHVAAEFLLAGSARIGVARWDGSAWQLVGGDMLSRVHDFAALDPGNGPALIAAGGASDSADSYLSLWGNPDRVAPLLACPTAVRVLEVDGSPPGEVVSFEVAAEDACDPLVRVECVPPSGSLFPRGTTLVRCTAVDASGNRASCRFPVTVLDRARPR